MFAEEQIRSEVAVMQCPLNLAPVIVMDYIEHDMTLQDTLEDPSLDKKDSYRQIANILLELSNLSFSTIGSLRQKTDGCGEVTGRPLSMPMNEIVRIGGVPESDFPETPFRTASSYIDSLFDLHSSLVRNYPSKAYKDWRPFLVARALLKNRVQDILGLGTENNGPFWLWCDDLTASNILVKEGQIVGIIDWEYSYTAPSQFTRVPPWWLITQRPEHVKEISSCSEVYEERLFLFLESLEQVESKSVTKGLLSEDTRLSVSMRDGWESGRFWAVYAIRKPFFFDQVFWEFQEELGGITGRWDSGLDLLDDKSREWMEEVVRQKELMR
ncbi:hypothetical protein BJX99DRAFT_244336 [Aspergillus californicus]